MRWIMLAAAVVFGLAAGRLAASLFRRIGQRWHDRGWPGRGQLLIDLSGPLSLTLTTIGLSLGLADVRMSPALRELAGKTLLLLFAVAVYWIAHNLVSLLEAWLKRISSTTSSVLDQQLVPLIGRLMRMLLLILAVLFLVDAVFERDIKAWLAGLGIAGLAVSLAAQDSLKNLFGSITILLDRPFRVGDQIVYAGYTGAIEEIGFRSTKVRTATGHLVTIPNSIIVNAPVENIGPRHSIRRTFNLTLSKHTPSERVQQAVRIVADILNKPPLGDPLCQAIAGKTELPRVLFSEIGADSLQIAVNYSFSPADHSQFMAHTQQVNLRILEEFEQAGIELKG